VPHGVSHAHPAVADNPSALEPLASALEGGWTATEWIGREQVKFWTLQEKTAKLLRSLHRDYAFDQLVSDAKDLYRTRREALVRLDAASRRGDEHTLREENDKVTQIDSELSQNLAQRDAWTDWKVYVELNRRIDERVKEMRRMWEEQERVPFDNAWKGHFGDRL
jgi:chromatin segregation and condensation protein Rec8/ScpA/Scc1 (kleisin family)